MIKTLQIDKYFLQQTKIYQKNINLYESQLYFSKKIQIIKQ